MMDGRLYFFSVSQSKTLGNGVNPDQTSDVGSGSTVFFNLNGVFLS